LVDTLAIHAGRHQIRTGFDYLRLTPSRKEVIASNLAHFASLDDLLEQRQPQIVSGEAPGGSSLIETASAFAQDTWSVNQRLNLPYGLRWEYLPAPSSRVSPATVVPLLVSFPTAVPSLWPAFSANPAWSARFGRFAPRAGLAYRLNRAGNLV